MASHKITLTQSSWNGGTAALYFDDVSQLFYDDSALTNEVVAIAVPRRDGWQFNGFYASSNAANPGTQYITAEGGFTDDFWSYCISHLTGSATLTIYANGTQMAWKLTLNVNGGIAGSGTPALWYALDGSGWYDNDQCQGDVVHRVSAPKYDARLFRGFYNGTTTPGAQYIDMDGNFLPALESLTLSAAKTIYASWASPVKITVSPNSGAGGTTAFYRDQQRGVWYADTTFSNPIQSIVPHVRACFELLGLKKTNSDTGVQVVAPDGVIDPTWAPTANATIYARWRRVSWKCTISKASGVGGTSVIYYKVGTSPNQFCLDDLCQGDEVSSVEVPTREGYSLRGIYSAASGGTEYITKHGLLTDELKTLAISSDKTFSAQWGAVYKIQLDDRGGSGGSESLYYDSVSGTYYHDITLDVPAVGVDVPGRECYAFAGYWSAANGGTLYIDADGSFTAAFAPTSARTIYAHWERVSYKVTLNDNGGTGGSIALYANGTDTRLFVDDRCTVEAVSVDTPSLVGHTFLGYYQTATGGSRYIDGNGRVLVVVAITSDLTIVARWSANQYTLTFDYDDGSGSTTSMSVTFGQTVGALPTATPPSEKKVFDCWTVDGRSIDSSTVWTWGEDKTAVVRWRLFFGDVEDYFELGSDALRPISSESGDDRPRVVAANATVSNGTQSGAGRYSHGVDASGCIWRNPTVTYEVVRDTTVVLRLGKAYPATFQGSGSSRRMTVSGWMVTSAKLATGVGRFPTLVVSATANEGADAINLFDVSVPVRARARAQNLLDAVVGGGQLQSSDVTASCTPVVCAENMVPCASDVVMGQLTVNATTAAPKGEAAPSAGGGFASVGEPKSNGDKAYPYWKITLKKEIF